MLYSTQTNLHKQKMFCYFVETLKQKDMNYRIVKETRRSGDVSYYVQKRFLVYFWKYIRVTYDMDMSFRRVEFDSLEEAADHVQQQVNNDYRISQSKVILREVVYPNNN